MDRERIRSSIESGVQVDFARSGGPGGQNVNKVNSKAIARIRFGLVEGLSAEEAVLARERLRSRLTAADELLVMADEERDQGRNRDAAVLRLVRLVTEAAHIPKPRRPTRPTRGSKERRLASKRVHAEAKRARRRPEQT
ncbi:MAG TPA: alternative ribosome rescue aminoacyl-tRNA hydrolase ArfB [Rectinemataceae bacterium]|nr:alternative ribosome rescue aminoacyl-tRNA hydrolase ArfB [Rectinemataceae bacterium]